MSQDKKNLLSGAKAEPKFTKFSDLPTVLQGHSIGFFSPQDAKNSITVSKRFIDSIQTYDYWNKCLRPEFRIYPAESKDFKASSTSQETAAKMYDHFPEKRLPQYYPDISTINEEQGAEFCRKILQIDPSDPYALSRLAFLTGMGKAALKEGDFSSLGLTPNLSTQGKAAAAIRRVLTEHPEHSDSLYHLAYLIIKQKINAQATDFAELPMPTSRAMQAASLYRQVLSKHPNHTETLSGLGNLFYADLLQTQPSDFFSATLSTSLDPDELKAETPYKKAALLYRMALAIKPQPYASLLKNDPAYKLPPYAKSSLFFLATAIAQDQVIAQKEDFLKEEKMPDSPQEQAALLYRRILRFYPRDSNSRFNLARLISMGQISAQAADFKGEFPIPENRLAQAIRMHRDIAPGVMTPGMQQSLNSLLGQLETKTLLDAIPANNWSALVQERFINEFGDLPLTQRIALKRIVDTSKLEFSRNFNKKRWERLAELGKATTAAAIASLGLFAALGWLIPFIGLETTLGLILGMAGSVGTIAYLASSGKDFANDISETREKKLILQKVETAIKNPANHLIFFPKLTLQESNIFKLLWSIPQSQWSTKKAFLDYFYEANTEQKQSTINALLPVNDAVPQHKKVVYTAFAAQTLALFFLVGSVAAGSQAMYETSKLRIASGYSQLTYCGEICAILLLFSAILLTSKRFIITPLINYAIKSAGHELMIGVLEANHPVEQKPLNQNTLDEEKHAELTQVSSPGSL